jgi:hypothetical protein
MLYGVTASEYNAGKKTTPPQHFLFDEFPASTSPMHFSSFSYH